jgi:chromate transporter
MDERTAFFRFSGATNLIPGPNSTEMAIHIGQERAGWKGLVVAGMFYFACGFNNWMFCLVVQRIRATQKLNLLVWHSAHNYCYNNYGILPLATKSLKTVELKILIDSTNFGTFKFQSNLYFIWRRYFCLLTATIRKIMSIVSLFCPLLFQFLKQRLPRLPFEFVFVF